MTNGSIDGSLGLRTCSTLAPCSASVRAQVGPASTRVRSRTRTPESGRAPCSSARGPGIGSGSASPMRSNLDHRYLRERDPLRMRAPFVGTAQLRAAYAALRERIFKRLRIPQCDRLRDRHRVIVALQKREGAFARTESAVQMNPSPVARSIKRGRRLRAPVERGARRSLVEERHERRRRRAHIHLDTLRPPAPRAPQIGRRDRIRSEHTGRRLARPKPSRDYRIAAR